MEKISESDVILVCGEVVCLNCKDEDTRMPRDCPICLGGRLVESLEEYNKQVDRYNEMQQDHSKVHRGPDRMIRGWCAWY